MNMVHNSILFIQAPTGNIQIFGLLLTVPYYVPLLAVAIFSSSTLN